MPTLYSSFKFSNLFLPPYYLQESAVLRLSSFVVFLYSILTVRFYILLSICYLPRDRNGSCAFEEEKEKRKG